MSRITGKDAFGLFEAYKAVYTPQELSEEKVWEQVENWVNSLLAEGYDLSDYTWEDMYDAYIEEARAKGVKPYKPQPLKPLPQAKPLSGEKGSGEGYGDISKFKQDTDSGSFKPGTTVPNVKIYNRISRAMPPSISDHSTRTVSANSTAIGRDPGAPRSQKIATTTKLVRTKTGWKKVQVQAESLDTYDIVLMHLLDEGYASHPDAAEAIMVNMSEEWREDIIEDIRGAITYNPNTPIGRFKRRIKGSTPAKREARTRKYQGDRSDNYATYGASQSSPYDDERGDIPSLRGH